MVFRGDGGGGVTVVVMLCSVSVRVARLLRDTGRSSWTVSRPTWCSVGMGYSCGDVVFCVTAREVRLLRDTGRPSWTVSRPIWCSVGMGCGCGWITVVVMLCSMLQ